MGEMQAFFPALPANSEMAPQFEFSPSFPRRRDSPAVGVVVGSLDCMSNKNESPWIPACAGMTAEATGMGEIQNEIQNETLKPRTT
jgi:hypothetical protein